MGLLSTLRNIKSAESEMRILMVGLDNAGKTTIVKRILNQDTSEVSPTLGFNIQTQQRGEHKINFWDVGGQKTIRTYWKNCFEATDGLIWVIDSTDRRRMDVCKTAMWEVLKAERLAGSPVLVFTNKQDIETAMNPDEIVDVLELKKIQNREWKMVASSAITGAGVEEGINWIIERIVMRNGISGNYNDDDLEGQYI